MKKNSCIGILLFYLTIQVLQAQITPANNVISVDVNTPQSSTYTYDSAFTKCLSIGMKEVGLSLPWTSIETSPGVFDMTNFNIANVYYPAYSIPVDLTIAPINTNVKSVPSDLLSTNFDSPAMVARFKKLLDSIFVHTTNLQLSSLVIGSEVDVYLGTNATLWTQYTSFYSQVTAYAKTLRPSLKVSCEASLGGLTTTSASTLQTLNAYSDYTGVSYYPLNSDFTAKPVNVIVTDFAALVAAYPSKPIYIYQYGYPSATICNSSLNQQAQFITQTFTAWDTYKSNIKMIDFTWMHDYSPAAVSYYSTYYGITDPVFLGYLGSIGLRTYSGSGTNKPAFDELICQANQRGYNSLTCITGLSGTAENKLTFSISPNPASDHIYVAFSDNQFDCFELKIVNQLGQEVLKKSIENNLEINCIDVSRLPSGIYFVHAETDKHDIYNQKIVIKKN